MLGEHPSAPQPLQQRDLLRTTSACRLPGETLDVLLLLREGFVPMNLCRLVARHLQVREEEEGRARTGPCIAERAVGGAARGARGGGTDCVTTVDDKGGHARLAHSTLESWQQLVVQGAQLLRACPFSFASFVDLKKAIRVLRQRPAGLVAPRRPRFTFSHRLCQACCHLVLRHPLPPLTEHPASPTSTSTSPPCFTPRPSRSSTLIPSTNGLLLTRCHLAALRWAQRRPPTSTPHCHATQRHPAI
jgi:hypothetical protein